MNDSLNENLDTTTIGLAIKSQMLKYVAVNGSFFITDLAKITGYSLTTIIKYVNIMKKKGYVMPLGKIQKHDQGRQSTRYGINPDTSYFVGVDVKKFELSIGLMNFVGKIITKEDHPDIRFDNTYENLDYVCNCILEFIEKQKDAIDTSKISCVCMDLSGRVNSAAGTSASVFNFEEMQNTPLADILSEKLNKKVFIENDTKAMAYGEYMSGLNKNFKNLLYVNIGWGLGLGIIINGRLYYGMDGYSGEIGHIHQYDNNIMCHCGKKGCVETEISGRAIHRKLLERIKKGEISVLSGRVKEGHDITMNDIIEAENKEDPLVLELIEDIGMKMGQQLAALINIFNPEAIVIGGSLVESEINYLLQSIELTVRKYSLKLMCQNVKILTTNLKGDAGITGACMIARQRMFKEME